MTASSGPSISTSEIGDTMATATVALPDAPAEWVERYRKRTAKVGDPLAHRRIVDAEGRGGRIERAHYSLGMKDRRETVKLGVRWDDPRPNSWGRPSHYQSNVDLATVSLLDAPRLTAPVRVRKVIVRGTKEQVAQRWADLGLDDPEGERRQEADWWIEFQPDVAAYRRWRLIRMGPAKEQNDVDALPSEHPRAVAERKQRKDSADYGDEGGYGY